MDYDITFCVNKDCPKNCNRKISDHAIPDFADTVQVSMSDFGKDYKGDQIDYDKCEYYWEG